MKRFIALPVLLLLSGISVAAQTQMSCRPLIKDDFIGPKESIVNGTLVCHEVQAAPVQAPAPVVQEAPPPPPAPRIEDGKVRMFVTDNPIFEHIGMLRGSSNSSSSAAAASASGNGWSAAAAAASSQSSSQIAGYSHTQSGADPRTMEVQADLVRSCPNIVVTNNPDNADYVLVFRREGGKRSMMFVFGGLSGLALSAAMKVDGASLFAANGDMVYAAKQRTVSGTIKEICKHTPQPQVQAQQ